VKGAILVEESSWSSWIAFAVITIALVRLVVRSARRHPTLRRLILPAVCLRLTVLIFQVFVALPYYASLDSSDAMGYHLHGIEMASEIQAGNWAQLEWMPGVVAVRWITALVYLVTGANIYGMFLLSAVASLAAAVWYAKALLLCRQGPGAAKFAALVLFLPSFAFWTSLYGKDSLVALGLALACYGYALWLNAITGRGVACWLLGLLTIALIRPHIATAVVAATIASQVSARRQGPLSSSPAKLLVLAALVPVMILVLQRAQAMTGIEDLGAESFFAYTTANARGNQGGGSAVEVPAITSPSAFVRSLPEVLVRIFLRPFPWEAHNFNSMLAALENLFLLYFLVRYWRGLPSAVRLAGRQPYLTFCLVYSGLLILMLSSIPNLGLLSRQRAMLLPFFFGTLLAAGDKVRYSRDARRRTGVPVRLVAIAHVCRAAPPSPARLGE